MSAEDPDPVTELGKLLEESGAMPFFHAPGCPMKLPCVCSLQRDVRVLRAELLRYAGMDDVADALEPHRAEGECYVDTVERMARERDDAIYELDLADASLEGAGRQDCRELIKRLMQKRAEERAADQERRQREFEEWLEKPERIDGK